MLKIYKNLFKPNIELLARDCSVRSKHSNEGLNLQIHRVTSQKSGFHQSQVQEYPAAKPLPLPSNIEDIASTEKLRFSPQRTRDINASFISFSSSPNVKDDGRLECYDCRGTVSLSSAMQTNVPFPFSSRGKPTHLNMPGGQWGQNEKYMSDDLNKVHHTNTKIKNTWNGGTCNLGLKTQTILFGLCDLRKDFMNTNLWCGCNMIHSRSMCSTKESKVTSTENSKHKLSSMQKLKAAVKDYGMVLSVFHTGISLVSLGCCYLIVASGLDPSHIVQFFGIEEGAAAAGTATQFVVAYAVHKVLAPVRISISLTVGPLIVKKLRKIGILKPPNP